MEERSLIWETVYNRLKDHIMKINECELTIVNDVIECEFYQHAKYENIISSLRDRLQSGKEYWWVISNL